MIEIFWIKSLFSFSIVLLSGLLGVFFYQKGRGDFRLPIVLFFSFLAVNQAIELIYSIVWIREELSFSRELLHFSFGLNAVLGPLLLMHVRQDSLTKKSILHFVPAVMIGMTSPFAGEYSKSIYFNFYLFAQFHFVVYTTMAFAELLRFGTKQSYLLIGFIISRLLRIVEFILWQRFESITEHTAWVLYIFSDSIFIVVLIAFLFRVLSAKPILSKAKADELPFDVLRILERELIEYLSRPEVYRDPLISVKKVADHFKVGPHYISKYINRQLQQSFLEVINTHRIKSCIEKLQNPAYKDLSIQDVFYDAGFNSKSVFNTTFKKKTGLTPSEFRRKIDG